MAKRIFALLVFLSAGAQANGSAQQLGGCIVFNEIIYQDVTASGWGMTGADLVFTNFREPSVVLCNTTMLPAKAERARTLPGVSAQLPRVGGVLADGAARAGAKMIRDN